MRHGDISRLRRRGHVIDLLVGRSQTRHSADECGRTCDSLAHISPTLGPDAGPDFGHNYLPTVCRDFRLTIPGTQLPGKNKLRKRDFDGDINWRSPRVAKQFEPQHFEL